MKRCMILAIVFASSCAGSNPYLITGESIKAAGEEYTVVAPQMNIALDSGAITKQQYRGWATFAHHFDALFPFAVEGWKIAVLTGDAVKLKDVSALLAGLVGNLATYWQLVQGLGAVLVTDGVKLPGVPPPAALLPDAGIAFDGGVPIAFDAGVPTAPIAPTLPVVPLEPGVTP